LYEILIYFNKIKKNVYETTFFILENYNENTAIQHYIPNVVIIYLHWCN